MIYPTLSEYIEAIKDAEDNFATLTDLRPVLGNDGNPVMSSGNYAVVFKMEDAKTGEYHAVKCFLRDQDNRAESYRTIAEALEFVQTSYLTRFRYYDDELFVDSACCPKDELPVLVMDWVEGTNLDRYLREHLYDSYAIGMLAYRFSRLAMWLIPQEFSHGDVKPDNIMVKDDGSLVLIDYDGMFTPAMEGQTARELGSLDFRHPLRTETQFNEHIDDFSLISILLSLRAIASEPSLLEKYGAQDRLLFSDSDYRNIKECQLLKEIFPSADSEINTLVSLFTLALIEVDLSKLSFRLLGMERPKEPKIISTEVTDEDWTNYVIDEYGVKYSRDGKKILGTTDDFNCTEYKIRDGVRVVCDGAFWNCESLRKITIPNSVKSVGDCAFNRCTNLEVICLSPLFVVKDNILYTKGMKKVISCWSSQQKIELPNSVTSIGNEAFWDCSSLQQITIPNSVTSIGDKAFYWCESLQQITIPDGITSIGDGAFSGCTNLEVICLSPLFVVKDNILYTKGMKKVISCWSSQKKIDLPDCVTSIGNEAFLWCDSLLHITIPNSVKSIGDLAFWNCKSLQQITIPNSVTSIGYFVFFSSTDICE